MQTLLGYTKPLYILPFDHRGTFAIKVYNVDEEQLTQPQVQEIKSFKKIIYDAFIDAVSHGIPKDEAAILVDEDYGSEILVDARMKGYATIVSVEKSGQDIFTFAYGDEFGTHLEKFMPRFSKALIRYNPEDSDEKKQQQQMNLKKLSDYSHLHGFKFLIEPLVPASQNQLATVNGDYSLYDKSIRPKLTVQMINELQTAGVEPDVWKLEGLDRREDYEEIVLQIRSRGRNNVGMVILGRGVSPEKVEEWFRAGASVAGVIGFAVGRTIFWDALMQYHTVKITREQAIERISRNFRHFYEVFNERKNV
jgi:myo-inositol catabolism protein IolC